MQSRFEVYEDTSGLWRWRHVADSGELIAESGKGYVSKEDATDACDRALELAAEEWYEEGHK
jgi:uncharacterized protein YegP (UPF0339 family)